MKIDYISDLHIDFYISPKLTKEEFFQRFINIQSIIYPVYHDNGKILVLAGDISHYINQIKWVIEFYSEMYEYVLYVHGNHEMYSLEGEPSYKHKLSDLKNLLKEIYNCYYLDGDIIEIDNIKIGGLSMCYDYSYGIKEFSLSKEEMHNLWKNYMNDSTRIKDGITKDYTIHKELGLREVNFNPLEYFESEYKKLESMKDCKLIISHVMPFIPKNYPSKYKVPSSGFFCFDGEKFLNKSKVKYWIAGHTHTKIEEKRFGVKLLVNPYGYPNENWDKQMRSLIID